MKGSGGCDINLIHRKRSPFPFERGRPDIVSANKENELWNNLKIRRKDMLRILNI